MSKVVADTIRYLVGRGMKLVDWGYMNGSYSFHFLDDNGYYLRLDEEDLDEEILCDMLGIDIDEYDDERIAEYVAEAQMNVEKVIRKSRIEQ